MKNATVRFFPESYCMNDAKAVVNSFGCGLNSQKFESGIITDEYGTYMELKNITGNVIFRMPDIKHNGVIEQPDRKLGKDVKNGNKYESRTAYFD